MTSPQNAYRTRTRSTSSAPPEGNEPVHENIASADLQNPSDALDILAQVADRADDSGSPRSENDAPKAHSVPPPQDHRMAPIVHVSNFFQYKPLNDGIISPDMVHGLFNTYEQSYHPYFPIAPRESFNPQTLPQLSRREPHLFSAILAVASKDDEKVHRICYDHMQQMISDLVAGADAGVEAVEALLILAQWVSHRPQPHVTVGRGEEDRQAWMYVGTAVRLGFFLGIDRTSFKTEQSEHSPVFIRSKLAWVACYISDRAVAVRLGKGFWARGPGPLSGLRSQNFPSLQPRGENEDNYAAIFQANLELIQIFSNVHDILYSSKGNGWKEMLEGRYAKYLDDFRASIRTWNDQWGSMICSPRLKASLMLSYDYLRLYVNAFAYQATISRAIAYSRDSQHPKGRTIPLINAAAPDARFIYEALDAAKSLLSTFNNFVDPEILRYMPIPYYLFIIYSAVFLYKARSTTTMTDEERASIRRLINLTIERLQKASAGAHHMGSRYARLLQMLWRKNPKKAPPHDVTTQSIDERLQTNALPPSHMPNFDPNIHPSFQQHQLPQTSMMSYPGAGTGNGNTFSWLDLGAAWSFATQNNTAGEIDMTGSGSEGIGGEMGSPFDLDIGLLGDYRLLDSDNPNLIF
jgi:hypothetical protein